MTRWEGRTVEEQSLLNPAFCAMLLWHAAAEHATVAGNELSLAEAFLVLPFVLQEETRDALPRSVRTSLAAWLLANPLAPSRIAGRARMLVPYTREALLFGGLYGFVEIAGDGVRADPSWAAAVSRTLRAASSEVSLCAKRAGFVGKWFASAGTSDNVLSMIGVQP